MNDRFSRLSAVSFAFHVTIVLSANAQHSSMPSGQALLHAAARQTAEHITIESKLRVRTDLMGQPLIGSGEYAQLRSSSGLLLRLELTIQAGEQATTVRQISDGRDLWEHWRIGEAERLNHVDMRRVDDAISRSPGGSAVGATSTNLARGGIPRLLSQLEENFDFSQAPPRSGKIGDVPVWSVTGEWKSERLVQAVPQAVDNGKIVYEKLPSHLPHHVEVLLGRKDSFPYRVTYHRIHEDEGKRVAVPMVTTEFYEVAIGEVLDASQFHFRQPDNLSTADRTEAFIRSLGLTSSTEIATKPDGRGQR